MRNGLKLFLTCFSLSILCSFASAQGRIRAFKLYGTTYVKLSDIASYYGMSYSKKGNKFYMGSRWTRIDMKKDSRRFEINGTVMHFSFAPALYGGKPAIATSDFLKVLDPVLRHRSMPRKVVRRVMIDPGHGGKDRGASGKLSHEKDIVLNVGLKLSKELRSRGYEVYMTRTKDSFPTLSQRSALAKRVRADLFISIHTNSATPAAKGLETFVLAPKNTASTSGKTKRKKLTDANYYDKQSLRLGFEIHRSAVAASKATDRGVKHAQFSVLDKSPCPAALIELGFISNRTEENRLRSSSYQNKLVKGIADGVCRYASAMTKK